MAGPLEAIISALMGRGPSQPAPSGAYPTDYMNNRQRMNMMGAKVPGGMTPARTEMVDRSATAQGGANAAIAELEAQLAAIPTGDGGPRPGPMPPTNMGQMYARPAPMTTSSWDASHPGIDSNSVDMLAPFKQMGDAVSGVPDAIAGAMGGGDPVEAEVINVDPGSVKHDAEEVAEPPMADNATEEAAESGNKTRQVKRGDSLWKIAEEVAGTKNPQVVQQMVKSIAAMNGIKDVNSIRAGATLKIPGQNVPSPNARGQGDASEESYG